jgi:hypothetical protein
VDVKGKRLADVQLGDFPEGCDEAGTYWKYVNEKGEDMKPPQNQKGVAQNLTQTMWGYHSPNGKGIGTLSIHTVREHEDGTISVRPNDGSSNSIMHNRGLASEWHGYIEHGEWQKV